MLIFKVSISVDSKKEKEKMNKVRDKIYDSFKENFTCVVQDEFNSRNRFYTFQEKDK